MKKVELTPFQKYVFEIPEDFNIFLGGGRGGGKSYGAALLIFRHCVQHKDKAKVLCVRTQHKANADFEDLVEELIKAGFGPRGYIRNRQDHTIRINNRAVIEFGEINVQSYSKYQGRQYSLLVVDEVGEFVSLREVYKLQSNLRMPGVPLRTILISNPGGPQHVYLSKKYINGRTPWKPFKIEEETWVSCPSTYDMNPHLDHKVYASKIRAAAGGDEALAKAWLEGDWGAISGAFFSSVLSEKLWYEDDWKPPKGNVWDTGWLTGVAIDWGWSAPAVTYLWARPMVQALKGPLGRIYPPGSFIVVDELACADPEDPNKGLEWPPQMLAEEILIRCKNWNVMPKGCCDDARGLEGSTLIQQLNSHGLSLTKPKKDRISGWVALKTLMSNVRDSESDKPIDKPGIWMSSRCRYALETLYVIPRNELRLEDCNTKCADHAADTLRYMVTHEAAIARVSRSAQIY